jgi:hypothetical protein
VSLQFQLGVRLAGDRRVRLRHEHLPPELVTRFE